MEGPPQLSRCVVRDGPRRLPSLFVASRGGRLPVAAAVGTSVLVVGWTPTGLREVPVVDGVALVVLGIAAVLPALCCFGSLVPPGHGIEGSLPRRRLAACRAVWVVLLTAAVLGTGATTAVVRGLGVDGMILVLRSGLFGIGAAVLSSVLLRPPVAWLPLALFAMLSWLCGSRDLAGTARWWAVLSHPTTSASAAVLALSLWVLALASYARWDARPG